jgi:phosphopantothenoylcysteine decarboxylase/phosphopantothenate--cysteine ligase
VVTAALLATRAPVVVAPAMNTHMLEHPAVVANVDRLRGFGHRVVAPDAGELACGYEGPGRLPNADALVAELEAALSEPDLSGRHVLVSAGPTREPIDPVRYVSNRSSGRMGYAVAAAALRRGARVTLVSGPTSLQPPRGCEVVRVETAAEMSDALRSRVTAADVVVMVAAVADYRPSEVATAKIKKKAARLELSLEKTEDILSGLAAARGRRVVVGFAAETNDVRANAIAKLQDKGLDLIVANDVAAPGSGFEVATNAALLIDREGREVATGLVTKDELADRVLDGVVTLLGHERRAARGA